MIHRAITAWQAGASGLGILLAVIDSGIDSDSPEFAGRLSAASADVAGARGLDNAHSDHGTRVAQVAAAARDNTGVMGIAWGATIMALRADRPGSCATYDPNDDKTGCRFEDADIAAGVSRAVQSGARIINISLGGSSPDPALRSAIASAAAAGVVIVVSAGNDGDSTEAGVDPNNPDPFAAGLRSAGNGHVIIAGSVGETSTISAFSNRAGSEAQWFLAAQGERVCCVYENGVMKVDTDASGGRFVSLFSGTSFSAPQIAGAAALLLQAFPNLTGAQVVDLLLRSARDAGTAGTDSTYGRGILDIANAFAPQGATSLAGTDVQVSTSGSLMTGSAAMGDSLSRVALGSVVLDSYERAYSVDFGANLASAPVRMRLGPALLGQSRQISGAAGNATLAFSISARGAQPADAAALRLDRRDGDAARVLAGRMIARLTPGETLALAFGQGADGLVGELQGGSRPAFLVAGEPTGDYGFDRRGELALAWRRQLGRTGLTVSAERARLAADWNAPLWQADDSRDSATTRIGLAADRKAGPLALALGLGWMDEQGSILGARMASGVAARADSLFLDASARLALDARWELGASWRGGQTWASVPGLTSGRSVISTQAWAVDVSRKGAFSEDGRIALRLSQPLRVSGGGLSLLLPTGWSYADRQASFSQRHLSLVPTGRELTGEINLQEPLWGGWASASLFARRESGHYAAAPVDAGVGLRWSRGF